mmetsp:Transcript_53257/g.121397  ORF Transcript_53257/g.121397 Transcript_53257/m.121397 type:complete len:95 (-) Transcript_53257:425-709(-)|eukprot:CAMPEP_0172598474 /NCGR_PEP_ID=MMETSP1068-20121228/18516_1 /TAXON_ID=35684 /ORGANISM="Pseudopedinella elastica, Strain CCMP716" /LENGTH=94 /DNA_ID=CAMNT_0013398361 /DNA_START=159 /DNA_END=443 /DNA_ORIENTATION=+
MAFRTSLRTLARYDVNPHLVKMWKNHKHMDGQVVRTLSPFEQNVIGGFFKAYPAEILKNAREFAVDAVPAFIALYCVKTWGESYFHQLAHDHRD